MSIVGTPEGDLSHINWKYDKRKLRTSSVKSSSKLFSCSVHAIYNRVKIMQKKRLMLKSYISGNNSFICPMRHYENPFSEKLVNELHDCLGKTLK